LLDDDSEYTDDLLMPRVSATLEELVAHMMEVVRFTGEATKARKTSKFTKKS
jgi:hypothetical protein